MATYIHTVYIYLTHNCLALPGTLISPKFLIDQSCITKKVCIKK